MREHKLNKKKSVHYEREYIYQTACYGYIHFHPDLGSRADFRFFSLPVEQYPNIAPPTVNVSATYTGADANAVMNSVIMPLEESINGVENMMYITSTATNAGTATIEVFFKQGTDPDMAAVNVQNRVSKAQGLLPAEVTKIGVSTQKTPDEFLTDRRISL